MSCSVSSSHHDAELRELRRELGRLRAENARLAQLVGLVGPRPLPDETARSPLFGGLPGAVNRSSSKADKVTFFRHLFTGRDDVHALRWENDRTGRAGWMPAVEGGFRRGQTNRTYLPLTDDVITAHLAGTIHAGLYPFRQLDRAAAAGHVPKAGNDRLPRSGDSGAPRRPVRLPVACGAPYPEASGRPCRGHAAAHRRTWCPSSPRQWGDPDAPASASGDPRSLGGWGLTGACWIAPALLGSLKHAASLHNPESYKREKRRLSTYGVPRFVRCYHEDLEWLHLPRGLREVVQDLVLQAGSQLEITDDRPEPPLSMTSRSTRSFSRLSSALWTPSSNTSWECWWHHLGRERPSSAAR